jgi:hypothetical protein
MAVRRRIENCPVSIRRIRVWSGGSSDVRKPGWAATESERPSEVLVSRLDSSSRTSAYLVINHMFNGSPVGSGRRTLKTGCSERIRANCGAGLIGSCGSRCERGQDSGSEVVVIAPDNNPRQKPLSKILVKRFAIADGPTGRSQANTEQKLRQMRGLLRGSHRWLLPRRGCHR